MSLEGKVTLITGASRGIGRAIALELGRRGAVLALNYRQRDEAARASAEEAARAGASEVHLLRADTADPKAVDRMVSQVLDLHGHIDFVVNNAGIQRSGLAHELCDRDWQDVLDVNLSGVFYVCRAVLPSMRAAQAGHIVNIASVSSFVAQPGAVSYVASKHALIGLTKALARENAPRNVKVNAVAPGLTETDMVRDLNEKQRQALLSLVPLRRMAKPAEVAQVVAWVLSEASYSTGNVFHVSGGASMG